MKVSVKNYDRIKRQANVTTEEQRILGFFYNIDDIFDAIKENELDETNDILTEYERYITMDISSCAYICLTTAISKIPFSWIEKFSKEARKVYGVFMYGYENRIK